MNSIWIPQHSRKGTLETAQTDLNELFALQNNQHMASMHYKISLEVEGCLCFGSGY